MKRIKAMNGYTIFELNTRDINNEFFNATAGNYVIYLSSDIREYGRSNSCPEYEDIETLKEAIELCGGSTATAIEIINESELDYTVENIETIEEVLTVAMENENTLIGITYIDPYADSEDISIISVKYSSLLPVIEDIRENEEVITGVSLRDKNGDIIFEV